MGGTEGEHCVGEVVHGIIPAYVGSSWPDTGSGTSRWDHPCVCGEQVKAADRVLVLVGSSPRMRGAVLRSSSAGTSGRIIPAHAGSSSSTVRTGRFLGSSPRMRGAAVDVRLDFRVSGIIPAHAGSSSSPCAATTQSRDHPRACGEQARVLRGRRGRAGSSPRMRGAAVAVDVRHVGAGIIPAHAGSSSSYAAGPRRDRDHPRACGEQSRAASSSNFTTGSSPRMRGAVMEAMKTLMESGIIPAHAGSRLKNPSSKHPIPLMWAPF